MSQGCWIEDNGLFLDNYTRVLGHRLFDISILDLYFVTILKTTQIYFKFKNKKCDFR